MKKYIKILNLLFIIVLVGCSKNNKEDIKTETQKENSDIECSEVGTFVSYKNNIYYWKLNKDSRSDSALFGNYVDKKDSINELVKINDNGDEEVIYKGSGSKNIVICNDKIYTSMTNDDYENNRTIYSIDLNGKNKKELGIGFIEHIIGNNIVGRKDLFDKGIYSVNLNNNEYNSLKDGVKLIFVDSDTIYYSYIENKNLIIGTIIDGKDKGKLVSISSNDFQNNITTLNVEYIDIKDNKIKLFVGYRDGSANMLQEVNMYTFNKDGTNIEKQNYTNSMNELELNGKSDIYLVNNNVMYKDDIILSINDIYSNYNLNKADDTNIYLYKSNLINGDVYFIFDYVIHDSSNDVGWRYSYKRLKTLYLRYNIKSKLLNKIYEF